VSEIAETAKVSISLADYGATDAAGKINIVGDGVAVLGYVPEAGLTNRFTLLVSVRLPTRLTPTEFPLEVALLDAAGNLAQVPGPAGSQPFRIAHVVQAQSGAAVYGQVVSDHIGVHVHLALDMSNGLPIAANGLYRWRVQLDGDEEHSWTYPFAVGGPPAAPVFG